MDIQGKVFIVTGGASGLGEGTARALAAKGGQLVIADMQVDKGEAIARELGGRFVRCDVSSEADGQAVVAQAVAMGKLMGLVNCAGIENSYMELEKPLVSNLTGTRKVIQVNLSIMTHYDDRVFKNVKKHEPALRSAALDVMRQTTEADLSAPDFRKDLAAKIRDAMNNVLSKYEDFGGIEEVFFTSFVVQ